MRHLVFLILALTVASCGNPFSNPPTTINGTWTLATVQSYPVAAFALASGHPVSGTLTVTNSTNYSLSLVMSGTNFPPGTGTVTPRSGSIYTFTDAVTGSVDYTLSTDGRTLSGVWTLFAVGPVTFTK